MGEQHDGTAGECPGGLLVGAHLRTQSQRNSQSAKLGLTPRSPALRRLRETMIFEANLGYIAISKLAWVT